MAVTQDPDESPTCKLGVKLENQVYVTDQGAEVLDTFPMALTRH